MRASVRSTANSNDDGAIVRRRAYTRPQVTVIAFGWPLVCFIVRFGLDGQLSRTGFIGPPINQARVETIYATDWLTGGVPSHSIDTPGHPTTS